MFFFCHIAILNNFLIRGPCIFILHCALQILQLVLAVSMSFALCGPALLTAETRREDGSKVEVTAAAGTSFGEILVAKVGHPSTVFALFFSTSNTVQDFFLKEVLTNILEKWTLRTCFLIQTNGPVRENTPLCL